LAKTILRNCLFSWFSLLLLCGIKSPLTLLNGSDIRKDTD
jgi:hypothetical protein